MTATVRAQVCIVGGGPGGLTLGLELARAGHDVVVVEQSGQFNRSFRGESISPDCVYLLQRLGVLDRVREQGVMETRKLEISDGGRTVLAVDFDRFDYTYRYPMELPQPTLLSVLADLAGAHPGFRLMRRSTAVELLTDGGRVTGVRCNTPDGPVDVHAQLTVGADGRYSKVRDMAGIPYRKIPLARDVVWLKLPFPDAWDHLTYRIRILGDRHGLFIPTYPDLIRVGFNIPKGGLRELRKQGIAELHRHLDELAPELSDVVRSHAANWSQTTVLDIFTTVVERWSRPGLVLVGDAAHTLSPILGQGVNHAIIDGVALAALVGTALGAPDPLAALDAAVLRFQADRQGDVRRSRRLQMRQEWLFTFAGRSTVLGRQLAYRVLNSSVALQGMTLGKAYFRVQPRGSQPVEALA